MFDSVHYWVINAGIDFLVLAATSIYLVGKIPRLYICMLVFNISQYVIPIPEMPALDAMNSYAGPVQVEEKEAQRASALAEAVEEKAARHGLSRENLEQASEVADGVYQSLGGQGDLQEKVKERIARNLGVDDNAEPAIAPGAKGPVRTVPEGFRQSQGRWQSFDKLMVDAFRDPHALWLFIRIFWLGAALALFVQRPLLGASAAFMNAMPVAFLAQAMPNFYLNIMNWGPVAALDRALNNPSEANRMMAQIWGDYGLWISLGIVLLLVVVAGLMRYRRYKNMKFAGKMVNYLDPTAYQVILNGTRLDFNIEGSDIVVGDIRFPLAKVFQDKDVPNRWYFGSTTFVDFVPR